MYTTRHLCLAIERGRSSYELALLRACITVLTLIVVSVVSNAQGYSTFQGLRILHPTAPSNVITFNPPSSLTSYSLTWPGSQGGAFTFLMNDGSGNLSWYGATDVAWLLSGNSGANAPFLGTTDNYPLLFRTNNTQVASLSADGSMRIGYNSTSLPSSYAGLPNRLFMEGGDESYSMMSGVSNAQVSGPHLELIRSRGVYASTYEDVQANDEIGQLRWRGYFGGSYLSCSDIAGEVDTTPSSGNVPGRIVFSTVPLGGGTGFLQRMVIRSDGSVGINTMYPLLNARLDVLGNVALSNSGTASQLRFYEPSASGTNYSSFSAQAQTADVNYTLPAADGTSGDVLVTNGSGSLSWTNIGKEMIKIKSTNESLTNSVTLQDDDELQFAVNANEKWYIDVLLDVTGSTGGIKCGFAIPTGSTMALNMCANLTAGNTSHVHEWIRTSNTASSGITITNNVTSISIRGIVSISSTAGSVKLEWAQSTSSGTATVVKSLSMMKYTRVQ